MNIGKLKLSSYNKDLRQLNVISPERSNAPSISPTNDYSSLMQKQELSPQMQHTDGGIKVRQAKYVKR